MSANNHLAPFLAIAMAALVTYGLRFGGLLLAERMPASIRFQRAMRALPGALMFSIVVPSALSEGALGLVATTMTALVAWKTGNVFAAMIVGMAAILFMRSVSL